MPYRSGQTVLMYDLVESDTGEQGVVVGIRTANAARYCVVDVGGGQHEDIPVDMLALVQRDT